MRPLELTATLPAVERRGPGTDAERRAARRLAAELGRERYRTTIEPFWCRPNWAIAHAWHVALALAGSLVSVGQPTVGAAILGAALISIVADEVTGVSPGRRFTPERASQNVVATPQGTTRAEDDTSPTTLIVTANYDAGRSALIYRDPLRRTAASIRRAAGPLALGWLAWLSLTITWSLAVAVLRATGHHSSHLLGAIQFPPTVVLVLALALLLEAATAQYGPAANDNASGTAVAVAVFRALAAGPPQNLGLELVLTGAGAGEGGGVGLRRYLRTRRRERTRTNTIVLGIAPCGAGEVHWWLSDGRLIPLRYSRVLRELAAAITTHPAHRGRGATPALPARARGLPALALGCLDSRGLPPRSHQAGDDAHALDELAINRAIEFTLLLVDEINAWLAAAEPSPTPA